MPHLLQSAAKFSGAGKPAKHYSIYPNLADIPAGGRIIFISATLHYTGGPLNTHGIVAKAGVDALSAQVAIELGPRGITSNVIAPGVIQDTEGEKRLYGHVREKVARNVPAGRLGSLKDVNNATVFLFSEAGDYVNGAVQVGESNVKVEFCDQNGY